MGRVRVQWRSAGKLAAGLAACLAALQVLPGLLKPPQAPPLAADVGLPRVPAPREPEVVIRAPRPESKRRTRPRPSHGISAAAALIGTTPRKHEPKRPQRRRNGAFVPPLRTKAPIAPEPAPAPPPEPAPPPGDGSVEFAPH